MQPASPGAPTNHETLVPRQIASTARGVGKPYAACPRPVARARACRRLVTAFNVLRAITTGREKARAGSCPGRTVEEKSVTNLNSTGILACQAVACLLPLFASWIAGSASFSRPIDASCVGRPAQRRAGAGTARSLRGGRPVQLDLTELVSADVAGIEALQRLRGQGATLFGAPGYIQLKLDSPSGNAASAPLPKNKPKEKAAQKD